MPVERRTQASNRDQRRAAHGVHVRFVALLALLASCRSPIGLDPAPPGEQLRLAQRSALTSNQLSGWTVRILETEGLPPVATEQAAAHLREMMISQPDAGGLVALAEVSFAVGMNQGGGNSPGWDDLATAALASWTAIFREGVRLPSHTAELELARALHNASLAQVVVGLPQIAGVNSAVLQCTLFGDPVEIDYEWHAAAWTAEVFDAFLPADDFRVRGMRNRNRQSGLGAALLGERVNDGSVEVSPTEQDLPRDYQTVALSAVVSDVRFAGVGAWPPVAFALCIEDPARTPTTEIAGGTVPLEADFTAALAHTLGRDRPLRRAGFGGLRDVEQWASIAGLYMLEPFDPERIPVVFIHGLVSSPLAWREMINDLWGDPAIRERYQFWFFIYPTGNPFLYSATTLRRELTRVRQTHDSSHTAPALDEMVLVGHSMGGLLTRVLVTDSGDALWSSLSDVPFDEANVEDADRDLLRESLFFEPLPGVARVVFIATPHRGSGVSDFTIGRIGSSLIRLPPTLLDAATRVFEANPDTIRLSGPSSPLRTSIDTLSPRSPTIMTLADLPLAPDVRSHSIIGRRSGGDGPGGTDGVVRFESAHVPGVESELIIAGADHSVPAHPAATREVRRILSEHAK